MPAKRAIIVVAGDAIDPELPVPIPNDVLMRDKVAALAGGVECVYYADTAAIPYWQLPAADAAVIIIMPSSSGSAVSGDYKLSPIPVVHFKGSTVNVAMNMTTANGSNSGMTQMTSLTAHPINTGGTGTITFYSGSRTTRRYTSAQLGGVNSDYIPAYAQAGALGNIAVFAYEAGTKGASGSTSDLFVSRRVFLGPEEDMLQYVQAQGWAVMERAVLWAANDFPSDGPTVLDVELGGAMSTPSPGSWTATLIAPDGPTVLDVELGGAMSTPSPGSWSAQTILEINFQLDLTVDEGTWEAELVVLEQDPQDRILPRLASESTLRTLAVEPGAVSVILPRLTGEAVVREVTAGPEGAAGRTIPRLTGESALRTLVAEPGGASVTLSRLTGEAVVRGLGTTVGQQARALPRLTAAGATRQFAVAVGPAVRTLPRLTAASTLRILQLVDGSGDGRLTVKFTGPRKAKIAFTGPRR